MRQLQFKGPRTVEWADVPEPVLQADHEALVAPVAATTCDVDAAVIAGSSPFRPPFALGHEAVGRIVALGDAVSGLAIGDLVSIPYHRCCGSCEPCRRQTPLHCDHQAGVGIPPAYGFPHAGEWGGMFADLFRVPHAGHALVPVPAGVDPIAVVSAGDNLTDAWSTTVPHLRNRARAKVLLLSSGAYGLYAAQWAIAAGAETAAYVDNDTTRLSVAARLGATPVHWDERDELDDDYDLVVNARPEPESLRLALTCARPDGVCESTAIFFEDVPLPLGQMHASGVRFRSAFASTRTNMPTVLAEIARGVIDPRVVESEVIQPDDVPARFRDLTHKPVVSFE